MCHIGAMRVAVVVSTRHNGAVTRGQQLLEDFRRQRRAGDPRITPEGRAILLRITTGDLADDFAESLAALGNVDAMLSGGAGADEGDCEPGAA